MNWLNLLVPVKFGDAEPRKHDSFKNRSIFEQDYDRIIFSSWFRKLQDKTQVIPLPVDAFVHNRLTHSIEVAAVGRSLGKTTGLALIKKYPEINAVLNITYHDIGAIIAAAALAHDIGNPPFGHSGEKAIGNYFLNGCTIKLSECLNEHELYDLCNFEGNANGFKLLNNNFSGAYGGLRLSYPTLAAFTKYPKPSMPAINAGVSNKKYGYFKTEVNLYDDIALKLLLQSKNKPHCYYRHPLAFLVEAADDICYSIIDFEDGVRLGLVPFGIAEDLLKRIAGNALNLQNYATLTDTEEKIAYLRAVAISKLIDEISDLFIALEESMLNCTFDESLTDVCKYANVLKEIKKLSYQNIYCSQKVLEIEAAGFEILGGLLGYFTEAYYHTVIKQNYQNHHYAKIMQLLPPKFIYNNHNFYSALINISQYVAGLTDRQAISMYRKLKGIELPI